MSFSNPLEIVDISEVNQETADMLLHAASTQGFLMVEGHGFSQEMADNLFKLSRNYFNLPLKTKLKQKLDNTNRGYTGFGTENLEIDQPDKPTGDPKEAFNFAYINLLTGIPKQPLPDMFKDRENEELIAKSVLKFRDVVHKILTLLAIGLKIDESAGGSKWFINKNDINKRSGSAVRMLHYPNPNKNSNMTEQEIINYGKVNSCGAHTDYGQLTVLLQNDGEPGLEVFSNGQWLPVPFVPAKENFGNSGEAAPLILNIADQLSYWTNGLLKSTLHRVRFTDELLCKGQDRYSVVFFSHPSDDTVLEPVPSELVSQIKGRGAGHQYEKNGKSITSHEHLMGRLSVAYKGRY